MYKTLGFIWLYISSMANILCQRISHQRFKELVWCAEFQDGPHDLYPSGVILLCSPLSLSGEGNLGLAPYQQNTATVMVGLASVCYMRLHLFSQQ